MKKAIKQRNETLIDLIMRYKLISLASLGIIFAIIFSVVFGRVQIKPSNSLNTPASNPFEHSIAGIGIVEASSGNINLGAYMPGIVSEVFIKEGDIVELGAPLFAQDQRSTKASLLAAGNEMAIAEKNLEMAKIENREAKDKYKRAKGLKSTKNISDELFETRKFASQKADMNVIIKENALKAAKHNLDLAQIAYDKTLIKSPIDGIILKVRIRPGEFISGNEQDLNSPILLGNHNPLHLRVKVDENDIWRFNKDLKANAFLRSNPEIKTSLDFIRIEPYASKKEQLRGAGIELIDTRIIDIIYKINDHPEKFYIGQQLDVFIESSEAP